MDIGNSSNVRNSFVLNPHYVSKSQDNSSNIYQEKQTEMREISPHEIQNLKDVGGAGGHGGFKVGTYKGEKVFLKVLDKAEYNNYEFLNNHMSPALKGFIPPVYGKCTIEGKEYLVMKNLQADGAKQIADIKLSEGGIANQAEMKATRGKPKNFLNYLRMSLEPKLAPGYMIAAGPKALRTFNYPFSAYHLKKRIGKGSDTQSLDRLSEKLKELETALKDSPMSFIGASLFIYKDKSGEYSVFLGDPAHAQANPSIVNNEPVNNLYTGKGTDPNKKQSEFDSRLTKNQESVAAMRKEINKMTEPEKTRTLSDAHKLGKNQGINHKISLWGKFSDKRLDIEEFFQRVVLGRGEHGRGKGDI